MDRIALVTEKHEPFDVLAAGVAAGPPGVLLVHDFWGVTEYNQAWAERFAAQGHRAAVVDLYDGDLPSDADAARARMRGVRPEQAQRKLAAAVRWLAEGPGRVITLGWSFGGLHALRAALDEPERVAGCVCIYSRMIADPKALRTLGGPVLGIYSSTERGWPEKQRRFEQAMAEAGGSAEAVLYDAGHGFCNPHSPHYDPEAAEGAVRASLGFADRIAAGT